MKCITCVQLSLVNKDMSTPRPVQDGVDGALDSVVVYEGNSLCVIHLHERMQCNSLAEYTADVEKAVSGRRN